MIRTCPVCDCTTSEPWHCGIDLTHRNNWHMGPVEVRAVHALARGTKGLDEETYRLRLQRFGVASCKDLTREQFHAFMRGLRALPNAQPAVTP